MPQVEIKLVKSPNDANNGACSVFIEEQRGESWNRLDSKNVDLNSAFMSGTLKANQRLVVAPIGEDLVYDPVQRAAVKTTSENGEAVQAGAITDQQRLEYEATGKVPTQKQVIAPNSQVPTPHVKPDGNPTPATQTPAAKAEEAQRQREKEAREAAAKKAQENVGKTAAVNTAEANKAANATSQAVKPEVNPKSATTGTMPVAGSSADGMKSTNDGNKS